MKVRFILTGEGTSDFNLVEHIENLLVEDGFDEASGEAPDLASLPVPVGNGVREKLSTLVELYPSAHVIFVHRDADNAGVDARKSEILSAADVLPAGMKLIPIIPVKELETWLLADKDLIKSIAGNPSCKSNLGMVPTCKHLENLSDAKSALLNALCEASETQGSRLRKFKKRFPEMRARLVFALDQNGPVRTLASYQSFRASVRALAEEAF